MELFISKLNYQFKIMLILFINLIVCLMLKLYLDNNLFNELQIINHHFIIL